ncbi:Sulfite reductase [NADPH] flavoprotein alpha-component [Serratia symbiotica]|nr:Sulfite reductase [NADPH] flavoprotein alpha-component [Serratia symbiotica]
MTIKLYKNFSFSLILKLLKNLQITINKYSKIQFKYILNYFNKVINKKNKQKKENIILYIFLLLKKKINNISLIIFNFSNQFYKKIYQLKNKYFNKILLKFKIINFLKKNNLNIKNIIYIYYWIKKIFKIFKKQKLIKKKLVNILPNININQYNNKLYNKKKPFIAKLIINKKITGYYSNKDIRHIEIDISNSNLIYQPGDALGIWLENDPILINELLQLLSLKGDELISIKYNSFTLKKALLNYFELTQNTEFIVKNYIILSNNKKLTHLLKNKELIQKYIKNTPIIDMIRQKPINLNAQQFINLLNPIKPRLYSISSSQMQTKNEIHITVSVVRYNINGRTYLGSASSFLANRLKHNDNIKIFIQKNNNFRLPKNPNAPIIMIGPGTGIAPFRAFMQQRNINKSKGKNWLFFGNQHFTEDFLYKTEWQYYIKIGLLTNIDLAWSRDQKNKIYVQDKLCEKGKEIWNWIKKGAYIYICGDANYMKKDVENILLEIIVKYGNINIKQAKKFLNKLYLQCRYQQNIY